MSIDLAFAKAYGFDSFFQNQLIEQPRTSWQVARIIQEEKSLYRLQCGFTKCLWAELSGRFSHELVDALDRPAVGDWVFYQALENSERAVIHKLFARKTCLYRKTVGGSSAPQILAVNVDTAFVLSSLNKELSLRRLERYFVLCRTSRVEPVLVLTKLDLCSENVIDATRTSIESEFRDIQMVGISVQTGIGLEKLARFLKPGHTIALLGSSGVGKSTLTNQLLQENILETKPVRDSDDKGRHTSTRRHLLLLPNGSLIIDTPGLREVSLMTHETGVTEVFDDIADLTLRCRFSNCCHDTEPGCSIKAAIASGDVSLVRWKSYLKLQRELLFHMQKAERTERDKKKKSVRKR